MSLTTRGLAADLRLAGQPDLPVLALLRHDAAEGALVRVVVVLADEDSIELPLDRALLTAGLSDPVTDGDVSVWVEGDRAAVRVAELTVLVGLAGLIDLLLASYAAAPTGSEHDTVIALTAARELLQA